MITSLEFLLSKSFLPNVVFLVFLPFYLRLYSESDRLEATVMVEPPAHKFASLEEEVCFWKEQAERHQQRLNTFSHTQKTKLATESQHNGEIVGFLAG